MNSEPPTGDDLTRMLVSMKQNVLQHSGDEKPRRSRFHVGLVIGLVALIAVGSASGAVALGLVPRPFAISAPVAPSPSVSAPAPLESSAPPSPSSSASAPPTLTASIPTDCATVVAASDYARLFGTTPRQQLVPRPASETGPSIAAPHPSTPSFLANPSLACQFRDPSADVSGLVLQVGSATAQETTEHLAALAAIGYTCADMDGGRSCQLVTPDTEYPVDNTTTFFARDGIWIDIMQTNMPTHNLLGAMTTQIWR